MGSYFMNVKILDEISYSGVQIFIYKFYEPVMFGWH